MNEKVFPADSTPISCRITKSSKRILKSASILLDMSYPETIDSALKEWAVRHKLSDRLGDFFTEASTSANP